MGVSKLSPMKVPLSACVLVLLVAAVQAAKCPDVSVVAPFNVTKYLGTWYEIAGSPLVKDTFERHCFCTHATYEVNPNSTLSVHNVCRKGSMNGTISSILGYATAGSGADTAKLKVKFPQSPVAGNYWVVSVDDDGDQYTNALVWSCTNAVLFNIEYAWLLSRSQTLDTATYTAPLNKLQAITGYDAPKKMTKTVQGCPPFEV